MMIIMRSPGFSFTRVYDVCSYSQRPQEGAIVLLLEPIIIIYVNDDNNVDDNNNSGLCVHKAKKQQANSKLN